MAITDQLESWWELNEASGSRADAHGSNTLTDNNTVTSTTGKQGNAALFVSANSESLSILDNASLSVGDYDWLFCGWVYFSTSLPASQVGIVTKGSGLTTASLEYRLQYNNNVAGEPRLQLRISDGSTTVTISDTNTALAHSTWYFVEFWFDSTNNQIGIRTNRGTAVTGAFTGAPRDGTGDFRLGADANGGNYLNGRLDEWGFWKTRLPSSTELDTIYNSGAGVSYADISGGGGYTLTADAGSFTHTGQTVNLLAGRKVGADSGAFTHTGQSVNLLYGRKVAAESGAFTHTGQAASLLMGRVIGADSGAYTLTGQDAGLIAARLLGADTGAFTLTGQDADLIYTPVGGYTLSADSGAYTLAGQAASLLIARLLAADSGAFTLTGQDATLVYQPVGGYTLVANAGAYDLTGQDAALLAARILTANSGAYELTGQAATLARGYLMEAAAGSYSVSGQDIATLLGRVLSADSGAYTLTGQAVTLVWSGATLPVTPSTRIYVVEAENRIYLIAAEGRSYTVPTERRVYAVSA